MVFCVCDSHLEGENDYTTNALDANAAAREEPLPRRRDELNAPERRDLKYATKKEEHAHVGAYDKRKERRRRRRGRHAVNLEGFSRTSICSVARRASKIKSRKNQRVSGSLCIASFSRTFALMICWTVAMKVRGQSSSVITTVPATGRNPVTPTSMPATAPPSSIFLTAVPQPSSSPSSTSSPTSERTFDPSQFPSMAPSTPEPTQRPSQPPSGNPSTTMAPTTRPTFVPSMYPSTAPSISHEAVPLPPEKITMALSIGFSVPIALFVIAALLFFARRSLAKKDVATAAKMEHSVTIVKEIPPGMEHLDDLESNNALPSTVHPADANSNIRNESIVSAPSFARSNHSVDVDTGSPNTRRISVPGDEENITEKQVVEEDCDATLDWRSMNQDHDAQGRVAGYSTSQDIGALMWGTTDGDNMAIEASVLCETNDWLRRNSGADPVARHKFARQLVKRMVASVSFNVIAPKDATRITHWAVAMLGLPLSVNVDVPKTTLLISGMPKNVTKQDVIDAFRRFGVIEGAAVSPNERGFGIVRYLLPRSVQRATDHFRTDEINVQDVAVDIKALSDFFPERNSQVQFAV